MPAMEVRGLEVGEQYIPILKYSREFILSLKNHPEMCMPLSDNKIRDIVLSSKFLVFPKAKEKDKLQQLLENSHLTPSISEFRRDSAFTQVKTISDKELYPSENLLEKIVEIIGISTEKRKEIEDVCTSLMRIFEKSLTDCSLMTFGSSASDVGIFNSHLDIYLDLSNDFSNISPKERRYRELCLIRKIWKLVWQEERFRGSVPMRYRRVPLVRIRDGLTGMKADLVVTSRKGDYKNETNNQINIIQAQLSIV